jgi:hypothetical protein
MNSSEEKKTTFQEKLELLFKDINGDEKELVRLFSPPSYKYSVRKKTVIDKWLYGEMKGFPKWKYNEYPISDIEINGIKIFPEKCFKGEEDINTFNKRLKLFSKADDKGALNLENRFNFNYRYIYYFDRHQRKIVETELYILQEITPNRLYKIKITPNEFYFNNRDITEYMGHLEIDNYGDYLISVENNFENLRGYFIKNRGYNSKQKRIYGLMMGRSYNGGVPLCNKNILSQERLSGKERDNLAIILNETEDLISDEEIKFYLNKEYSYFNKFYEKIKNIRLFLRSNEHLFRDEIGNNPYFDILYDTFFSFYMIASKTKINKRYWVSNKRRAYKTFLESLSKMENSSCYIVNPIFDSYIYLFDDYSSKLINHNIKCAKRGLKIKQIFIAKRDNKINSFIQKMIKKLEYSGIVVKFALLEDVEKIPMLKSYDFLYSDSTENVTLYRGVDDYKYFYNVTTKYSDIILKLRVNYKEIENIALPLKDFLEYQNQIRDPLIDKLYGVWHHYFYGSIKNKKELKIWKERLEIERNGDVFYKENDKVVLKGKLNITFSSKEAFIHLVDINSQNLVLIKFNKDEIYKGIFRSPILDNSFHEDRNMTSFGFFSKEKLDIKVVKEILGEEKNGVLIEDKKLQDRINSFLRKL